MTVVCVIEGRVNTSSMSLVTRFDWALVLRVYLGLRWGTLGCRLVLYLRTYTAIKCTPNISVVGILDDPLHHVASPTQVYFPVRFA